MPATDNSVASFLLDPQIRSLGRWCRLNGASTSSFSRLICLFRAERCELYFFDFLFHLTGLSKWININVYLLRRKDHHIFHICSMVGCQCHWLWHGSCLQYYWACVCVCVFSPLIAIIAISFQLIPLSLWSWWLLSIVDQNCFNTYCARPTRQLIDCVILFCNRTMLFLFWPMLSVFAETRYHYHSFGCLLTKFDRLFCVQFARLFIVGKTGKYWPLCTYEKRYRHAARLATSLMTLPACWQLGGRHFSWLLALFVVFSFFPFYYYLQCCNLANI